ncbi:polysaccharide biosynthesis/export family protein [Arcticibacter sp.]|uniref:polysaccharide biosynthesis/export family protein n=1 Tax=Arcticibacter sp. TaxID=1872630 RepID=UPI00388FE31C
MNALYKPLGIIAFSLLMLSCTSYKKSIYFQDVNRSVPSKERIQNFSPITIQPEDILGISISSLNPESSAVFNFTSNSVNGTNENYGGYLVDQKGDIQLPIIGSINVANLTTSQIRDEIRLRLMPYLKEPVVIAKLINFKISILGDVSHPGLFKVQSEKLSIPEALSLAGDLNITALRRLMIIRETNGEREYITVDLRKKSLFNSPYYYLKNNDVIYAEAGKSKFAGLDQTYQRIGLLLSIVSVAGIFLTR